MERVMVVNRRRPVTIYEVYDEDPAPLRAAKQAAQPAFDDAFALFDAGDVGEARAAFERCRKLLPDDPVATLHLVHCDAATRREMPRGQEWRDTPVIASGPTRMAPAREGIPGLVPVGHGQTPARNTPLRPTRCPRRIQW